MKINKLNISKNAILAFLATGSVVFMPNAKVGYAEDLHPIVQSTDSIEDEKENSEEKYSFSNFSELADYLNKRYLDRISEKYPMSGLYDMIPEDKKGYGINDWADYLNKNYLDEISNQFPMSGLYDMIPEDKKDYDLNDWADYLNKNYLDEISEKFPMSALYDYLFSEDKKDLDVVGWADYLNKNYLDEISNQFPMSGLDDYLRFFQNKGNDQKYRK